MQTSSGSQTTLALAYISSPVLSRHSVIASCRTSNSGSHIIASATFRHFVHQCLCAACNQGFFGGWVCFSFYLAVKSTPVSFSWRAFSRSSRDKNRDKNFQQALNPIQKEYQSKNVLKIPFFPSLFSQWKLELISVPGATGASVCFTSSDKRLLLLLLRRAAQVLSRSMHLSSVCIILMEL